MKDDRTTDHDKNAQRVKSEDGGSPAKMQNMTRDDVGFPSAAFANLVDHNRQLDADGVEVGVSRQALDEVREYIGRFMPYAIKAGGMGVKTRVDGSQELFIGAPPEMPDAFAMVAMVRLDGRTFVPEETYFEAEEVEDAISSAIEGAIDTGAGVIIDRNEGMN